MTRLAPAGTSSVTPPLPLAVATKNHAGPACIVKAQTMESHTPPRMERSQKQYVRIVISTSSTDERI